MNDALATVEAILSEVEFGPQTFLPTVHPVENTDSNPTNDTLGDLSSQDEVVAPSLEASGDGSEAKNITSREPASKAALQTPLTQLPVPKFETEVTALGYLAKHAHGHLHRSTFKKAKLHLSRAYLCALLARLVSWSMYKEAKSLYNKIRTTNMFVLPTTVSDFFENLSDATAVPSLVEALQRYESRHGQVPEELIVSTFQPFIELQDNESVEKLFLALEMPATVAYNLYLQSLLQTNHFLKAQTLYNQMLDRNDDTKGKEGADGYTLAIYMRHYAKKLKVHMVDQIMQVALSKRCGAPKRMHFEIAFECFLRARKPSLVTLLAKAFVKEQMKKLNESIACSVLRLLINVKEYNLGALLHCALEDRFQFQNRRYFIFAKMCISKSSLPLTGEINQIKTTLAILAKKAVSQAPTTTSSSTTHSSTKDFKSIDSSTSSYLGSDAETKEDAKKSDSNEAVDESLKESQASEIADKEAEIRDAEQKLRKFIISFRETHPTEKQLFDAVVSPAPMSAIIRLVIAATGQSTPETLRALLALALPRAETVSQLDTLISLVTKHSIVPTATIWEHHMRMMALKAAQPHSRSDSPSKMVNDLKNAMIRYEEKSGVSATWAIHRWRLNALYRLQKGKEAAVILEALLPSLQELMNAPSSLFVRVLPSEVSKPSSEPVQPEKTSSKSGKKIRKGKGKAKKSKNEDVETISETEAPQLEPVVEEAPAVPPFSPFQVPCVIASEFYAWVALFETSEAKRSTLLGDSKTLAEQPEGTILSAAQLRSLLLTVQSAQRAPTTTTVVKHGWKVKTPRDYSNSL